MISFKIPIVQKRFPTFFLHRFHDIDLLEFLKKNHRIPKVDLFGVLIYVNVYFNLLKFFFLLLFKNIVENILTYVSLFICKIYF